MSWRSLIISKPSRLYIEHNSLFIIQDEKVSIPIEDLAVIVLDNIQITITQAVLEACAECGICIFSINKKHLPSGIFLPFLQYYKCYAVLKLQISLGLPRIKQLWAEIIKQKIQNQILCLKIIKINTAEERLQSLAKAIKSGDSNNVEGVAAAIYFKELFGKKFSRNNESIVNSALNYGYSIFRGAIARGLVAHGFQPSLGIFHKNYLNAFNLADDIIEPYRPIVDLFVYSSATNFKETLTPQNKAELVSLLNTNIKVEDGYCTILKSIEYVVANLYRCYQDKKEKLIFPQIIGLEQYKKDT